MNKAYVECKYSIKSEAQEEADKTIICAIGYKDQPTSKEAIFNLKKNKGVVCERVVDVYDYSREYFEEGRRQATNEDNPEENR